MHYIMWYYILLLLYYIVLYYIIMCQGYEWQCWVGATEHWHLSRPASHQYNAEGAGGEADESWYNEHRYT